MTTSEIVPVPEIANETEIKELSIWLPSDDHAVINVVPEAVRRRLLAAREAKPELFQLDEQELAKELRGMKQSPTATDSRLRLKFWVEYDRALDTGKAFMVSHVIANVCSKEFFYEHYLARPGRCAWLICPVTDYKQKLTEALEFGLEQMRDILDRPHLDENGKIDHKLAALKLTVFKMLDDRKNGQAPQTVNKKSLHVHATIPSSEKNDVKLLAQMETQDELQKRLERAKAAEEKALHLK